MNNLNQSLETSGLTVEDAITHGLAQLNLARDAVKIEIIDEGSKGLFGLGSRDALVRLTPLQATTQPPAPTVTQPEPVLQPAEASNEGEEEEETESPEEGEEMVLEEDEALTVARETVTELLQKMHVDADVTAVYQPQEDERRNRPSILVEINGDDLSILIGRQAETLNALQYITRLIVGKELNRGVDLEVDVQGYQIGRASCRARG